MSAAPHPAEPRRVFGAFPSGVTAVAALVDDVPVTPLVFLQSTFGRLHRAA